MGFGSQARILFSGMVAQPEVLLLGSTGSFRSGGSPSPPLSLKPPSTPSSPIEIAPTATVTARGVELAIGGMHEVLKRAMPLLRSRADESNTVGGGMSSNLSETCPDWVPWSTWTLPAWICYMIFAALLSAACAHLVRGFAPYAAGSGISEIKCILAGFIINGYLGAWTLRSRV